MHRDMLQTGLGMADPELCRIFVAEVGDAIKRLHEMGLSSRELSPPCRPTRRPVARIAFVATQKAVIEGTSTCVVE